MKPQMQHRPSWARVIGPAFSSRQSSRIDTVHNGTNQRGLLSQQLPLAMLMVVLLFSSFSYAQKDPVNNFCRRFGHQTAVIDRKLYIDGGFINYSPLADDPTNYTSEYAAVSNKRIVPLS